jgi:hypothetical protein
MDAQQFAEFKAEMANDIASIPITLRSFVQRWNGREALINTLTPEQDAEMEAVCSPLDDLMDGMP